MAEVARLREEPGTDGILRAFLPHLRPHRGLIAAALAVTVASTLALVLIAPAVGWGVDAVVDGHRSGLGLAVAAVLGLTLARLLLLAGSERLLTRAGERVVRDLRDTAVERVATAPLRFVEAHRSGDLLRRLTGEVAELAHFVRASLPDVLSVALSLGVTTVLLLVYSWQLALVLLVGFVPVVALVLRWFAAAADERFGRQATAEATLAATFTENLVAREALQLAGAPGAWWSRAEHESDAVLEASDGTLGVLNRLEAITLLEGVATAALLLAGLALVDAGQIPLGTLVVFVLATKNLFDGVVAMSQLVGDLQASRIALARLLDLLARTAPPAGRRAVAELPAAGALTATDVRFGYVAGTDVLRDVDLALPQGDRAALVGPTGSGKTTLAKVLTGFYVPDAGAVRFGGVDLRDADPVALRRRIVLVSQHVHLVEGTIADNLALAATAPSPATMHAAVERLGLGDWVDGLAHGLDTDVGPRGSGLSAGEQQLVGLVRAALVDPAVIVLDEATAAVDGPTAARVEAATERLRADRTVLVIAHRPTTVHRLPRRVHLAAGRIADPPPPDPGGPPP